MFCGNSTHNNEKQKQQLKILFFLTETGFPEAGEDGDRYCGGVGVGVGQGQARGSAAVFGWTRELVFQLRQRQVATITTTTTAAVTKEFIDVYSLQ